MGLICFNYKFCFRPTMHVIADFGCGEAQLAKSVVQKVHSFDLVAANDLVTACDMAHVPLTKASVDVAVFCLSLMGTNLQDYITEANRVLKTGYETTIFNLFCYLPFFCVAVY